MRALSCLTDAATAHAIGAFWLERELEPVSSFGRRAREGRRAFAPGEEAQARAAIASVLEAAESCSAEHVRALRAALKALPEPIDTLRRAAAGEVLADVDLHEVLQFLEALETLRERMGERLPQSLWPERFDDLLTLLARGRRRGGGFYLDDGFVEGLARARAACAAACETYARERARLREASTRALGEAVREDGEFAIARAELRSAVPTGVRTVREAATYVVFELANDGPALEALEAYEATKATLAQREERARERLSGAIGRYAGALMEQARRAGEADLLLAAVAFAHAHGAVAPEILEHPGLSAKDAHYLPLERALAEHGRRYEPISLELPAQAVVSGPNMGGKSAALRTAGFVQLCVQWGLPVAAHAARVGLVERIQWLGAATEAEERSGLLSSFGREIVVLAQALRDEARPRLLLVDEFARTTSPHEGRALVVALLDVLRTRGEIALVTTHFAGVAEAAGVAHYAVIGLRGAFAAPAGRAPSLDEALGLIGESMDYRLGPADSSDVSEGDAITLARLLGLDERMTARAAHELQLRRGK